MIIHAYGVLASPMDVSNALSSLNISHGVVSASLRSEVSEIHLGTKQPSWPIVVPSVRAVPRFKASRKSQILFICDSLAQLSLCNVRVMKPQDLKRGLPAALDYAIENPLDWKLEMRTISFDEYVTANTKPSFLNGVQTELYRITPYDLRRTTQAIVIAYLAGTESRKNLMTKLNSSYKLDRLKALLADPKCAELKDAVAEYSRTQNVELAAETHKVATFEILYLSKSAANAKARG